MDVQLYVYDLSNGMARRVSMLMIGTYIDAVYHTSIVMGGIEYVYDGGVKTIDPGGSDHLSPPIEIIKLGATELPMDVILEYLDSLKKIYTHEAYDLWTHNCNNFSNDFALFLVGKKIPDHIANLPETVLNTPLGRALRPEVNRMVERRQKKHGGLIGVEEAVVSAPINGEFHSTVRFITTQVELDTTLAEAERTCAVIFFTSATCAPCKSLYPLYDELAAEMAHKVILIKVDVSRTFDVGMKYSISSTPTFISFLNGAEENRWQGADASTLRGNVKTLVQMAWPPHPHESLPLPALHGSNTTPVLYSKVPPLNKLKAKMGDAANEAAVSNVLEFVATRAADGPAEASLPDLDAFSRYLRNAPSKLPIEIMFTIVDLLRLAMADSRFSGYYAEEKEHKTIAPLIAYVDDLEDCPYSLRLVTLQMACNLFSSPLYAKHVLGCPAITTPIVQLITTSLLDDKHHNVRVAAASLSFNIAVANNKRRIEERREGLPDEHQIELAASLLEAISAEEGCPEALKGFLLALGFLVYCTPSNGDLVDMLKSMDAQGTILLKKKLFPNERLLQDIGGELLEKGLT